jgi:hypothetical protein
METIILVLQILCVAVLAFGTGLSMFQLMQGAGRGMGRFSYAASNDFETDFRRVARNGK